jgi:thiol-disulfide isomerase/thioredoxin
MKTNIVLVIIFIGAGFSAAAQQRSALDSAIHLLTKEKDAQQSVWMMQEIISKYRLDRNRDAETFDVLYGTVAVNFAMNRKYARFEKYIDSIRNKFNKTSFLNMAASNMLHENVDPAYANLISKRTLQLFRSFKNDTSAKPKDFSRADWERFMDFAQYPYYDTHAHSLFALKKYEEAIRYQKMAFNGDPEDGLPVSVERYAKLLEITGKKAAAKRLLLKMAGLGKLNKVMTEHLQAIYIAEKGSDERLGSYLDSLQKNVQATLVQVLKPKMLNETAPEFSLKDMSGKKVNLSDYAGRIVVLDLWATWCVPCIASFPAMQVMVEKHPDVTFLFIAVEEKEKDRLGRVKGFIEKNKYPFTVLIDEPVEPNSSKYRIMSAYRSDGIPAKYVIDKKGMLRFSTSGFDTDTELMNELEAMFLILKSL